MVEPVARLRLLTAAAIGAGRRFPVAVGGSLAVTLGLLLLVHLGADYSWPVVEWLLRVGVAFAVGGTLAGLIAEARAWPRRLNLGASLALGLLVAAHGLWLATDSDHFLLICGLVVGLLAWPAAAARHTEATIWAYDLDLLSRAALGVAVALVAWMGLGLLFSLLTMLLAVHVPLTAHVDAAILTFGLLAPLLFLGAVPDLATFDLPLRVPRWLGLLVTWVCVPLALAYLTVFQIYVLRIGVGWDLPDGQIAWFTIGIAGLGALAHWLAYPDRLDGPAWLRVYYRIFYPALAPILIVFALAIWQRIDAYGVTEPRYVLCLLLLWLGLMAALSARAQWYKLAYAPGVLALLLVIASVGPWSPTATAVRSQLARFQDILAKSGSEASSGVATASRRAPADPVESFRQLQSIVDFLVARDAHARLAAFLPRPPAWAGEHATTAPEREQLGARILADFGVAAVVEEQLSQLAFRNPWLRPGLTVDMNQVRLVVWLQVTPQGGVEPSVVDGSAGRIAFAFHPERQALEAAMPDGSTLQLALAPKIKEWNERPPESLADFTFEGRAGDHRFRFILWQLDGQLQQRPPGVQVGTMDGFVLIE